ncbi:MAG: hypothetical protein JWO86_4764 [Myxococcaceae bacterium]|nr:hypothetical protein [Myxococcaceae bacterium]
MTSLRSLGVSSVVLGAAVVAGVVACSGDARPPAAGSGSSGGESDAAVDRVVTSDEDGGGSGGDASSALPLGSIPTIDEPDVPCVMTNGLKTELFDKGDTGLGGPAVTRVQALGTRRFAAGMSTRGFITFDATGTTPKAFGIALGATDTTFTSEGTTIGAFALSPGTVDYQRYDEQGIATGGLVSLATGIAVGPPRVWVASGGGGSLVVWPSGSTLFAAGITAAGAAAGPAFTLATNATNPKVAITYAGDKYAIAYSYDSAGTSAAARIAFATPTGISGAPVDVGTADALEPVAITPTSAGFVLVVDAGGDEHVYVVPLDGSGKLSGPAHRLLGGDLPWGLASHGDDAALVVLTNDVKVGTTEGPRAPQFRPLDVTGKPTGPWVCLDAKIPSALYQDMGILAEPTGGYAVVYKSPTDTTMLVRVDKLGVAAP